MSSLSIASSTGQPKSQEKVLRRDRQLPLYFSDSFHSIFEFLFPNGETWDFVVTSNRLLFAKVDKKSKFFPTWGLPAIAIDAYEKYQQVTKDIEIGAEMLDGLVANGIAVAATSHDVGCIINRGRKGIFNYIGLNTQCRVVFEGTFSFKSQKVNGYIALTMLGCPKAIRSRIAKVFSGDVEISENVTPSY